MRIVISVFATFASVALAKGMAAQDNVLIFNYQKPAGPAEIVLTEELPQNVSKVAPIFDAVAQKVAAEDEERKLKKRGEPLPEEKPEVKESDEL